MDFSIASDIEAFVAQARVFAESDLIPRAAAFERDENIPGEIFTSLGSLGLMSVAGKRAHGGAEAGTLAYSLAMMEVARGCASTAVTMAVTNMVGEVIAAFGTEEQASKYCPLLAAGKRGAFALSEVGAGSDPGGMRTTAVLDGEHWVINGDKQWISHGDQSEVVVVWARTDGGGSKGLSCFLVEPSTPGFGVGKHEDKMGLRGSHTVGLVFEDMRVPASAMLGPRGAGFRIAMMALDGGRIGIASQAVGIAEGAFEEALAFALENAATVDQGVHFRLADIRTRLDAAKLLAIRAAGMKERGEPFSQEASIAKAFATETAWAACNDVVELMGDAGLVRGSRVERAVRDVRVSMIYEGTSEVQRVVISRGVLRP